MIERRVCSLRFVSTEGFSPWKNAKKRAIIAVARKLSVLLHRLWVTQAEYVPFYEMENRAA